MSEATLVIHHSIGSSPVASLTSFSSNCHTRPSSIPLPTIFLQIYLPGGHHPSLTSSLIIVVVDQPWRSMRSSYSPGVSAIGAFEHHCTRPTIGVLQSGMMIAIVRHIGPADLSARRALVGCGNKGGRFISTNCIIFV